MVNLVVFSFFPCHHRKVSSSMEHLNRFDPNLKTHTGMIDSLGWDFIVVHI
jgi:hypothetical protein